MRTTVERLAGALKRHGIAGAAATAAGLPLVAAGRRLDRWLRGRGAFEQRFEREVRNRVEALERTAPGPGAAEHYRRTEIANSLRRSSRFCYEKKAHLFLYRHLYPAATLPSRIAVIARATAAVAPEPRRILAAGCRDELELIILRRIFRNADVVGVDLFSLAEGIVCGDMHALPFPAHHFDCVLYCHSLEHAYEPRTAISEGARVLRPGGVLVIEVPVKKRAGDSPSPLPAGLGDRWDFHNVPALLTVVRDGAGPHTITVLHSSEAPPGSPRVQLIVRIGEAASAPA